jgi:hypothetical protein
MCKAPIGTKKRIKAHNSLMDLKKELSLIFLSTSFIYQYEEVNKDDKDIISLDLELKELSFKSRNYKSLLTDVLKVAQNEMDLVEKIQRNSKPTRFKKVCDFDEQDDLVVSAVGLAVNLLLIHKEIKNKKIVLSNNIYNISKNKPSSEDEIKNAQIVASRFYERICKYYDDRKIRKDR